MSVENMVVPDSSIPAELRKVPPVVPGDVMKKTAETILPATVAGLAMDDRTPNLNAALAAAVASTPWVEFTKPSGGGINYEYLAEEDIVKELRKVLPKHGLVIVPIKMTLVSSEVYNSGSGGRMVNRLIVVRYSVRHTSGERVEGEAMGEGSDRGDKSINKAMTGAFKYFLRELTLIAGGMDPDRTSSDELARVAKVKGAAPQTAATGGKPATGGDKPAASLDDRFKAALASVGQCGTHVAVKAAAKKAAEIFATRKDLLDKVRMACAARATILFIADVSKADSFEAVEAVVKVAEKDNVGTENLAAVKSAAQKRNEAIAGAASENGQSDDDAAVPLEF